MRFQSRSSSSGGASALILLVAQLSNALHLPAPAALHPRQDLTPLSANSTLLACLQPLGSKVLERETPNFEKNRWAFDYRYTFKPEVVIMATSTADVQTAVKCAKASKVAVAPRSGGHSYEGYSIGGQDGSVVIDLSAFSSVVVSGKKAKVGAGVRLGPLYYELHKQGGWTINAGTCPTVGIGGHALGGGFGMLGRKYGLMLDRVVEMELVNANGDLLTASASKNPDLFYALRGAGGGSYGVVTSFTILPIKPAKKVTSFAYSWNYEELAQVLKAYVTYGNWRDMGLGFSVTAEGVGLSGLFQGPQAQQAAAMAVFLKLVPKPNATDVRETSNIESVLRFAYMYNDPTDIEALNMKGSFKPGDSHYTKGKSLVFPSALKNSTIALLAKWGDKVPEGSSANYILIDRWGGAIEKVPVDATSFVHRNAHTVIQFVTEWDGNPDAVPGTPDCKACLDLMNEMYSDFLADYKVNYGPVVHGYQNYIDSEIPNWQAAYYGSAFSRLKQIKAKTDPENVFRFPMSIPLM
ncbi:hypothetical protein BGZ67_008482 [Mortierella alpina]|nr:hypothetical protein BGZ67_008482 [Mortierella alpina]